VSLLEVPLIGKMLLATGDILLRAELDLLIKTNLATWEQVVAAVCSRLVPVEHIAHHGAPGVGCRRVARPEVLRRAC
jgi:hypothetical protein